MNGTQRIEIVEGVMGISRFGNFARVLQAPKAAKAAKRQALEELASNAIPDEDLGARAAAFPVNHRIPVHIVTCCSHPLHHIR